MTRRFDGAITTPEDAPDSTTLPAARRPPRPVGIESAAAILIAGGIVAIIGTIGAMGLDPEAADPGARPVIALILALNVLTVIVGLLVRRGQAWIVCINVVAVLLFIELTAIPSGGATAALLAVLDGFVFVALARNRAWFDWRPSKGIQAR
ncbi:MAG: hypothetical protein Q7S35_04460 [Candidatus Limnocylindrales bacterium]|nr:hypothetical protein [Candidatus Limnocylindrales bacterium]